MACNILLGSGVLYIAKIVDGTATSGKSEIQFSADGKYTPKDVETEVNKIGSIKGGASLNVTPEIYEVADDLGICVKRFITNQEVILKSGVLSWNLEKLQALSVGGVYKEATVASATTDGYSDTTKSTKTLAIGTQGSIDRYLVRFVHTMDNGLKVRVTIVGTASSGFEISFKPDEETVIDAEFKAVSLDNKGTQVVIEEESTATVSAYKLEK